ncbi:MAG: sugar transferase [Candidatus Nanopelagicales bacterium]
MAAIIDLRLGRTLGSSLPVAWSSRPALRLRRRVVTADLLSAVLALLVTVVVLGASEQLLLVLALWGLALRQVWYVDRRWALNPRDVRAVWKAWMRAALPFAAAAAFIPALHGKNGLMALVALAGVTYVGRVVVARQLVRDRRAGLAQVPVVACGSGSELSAFQEMLSRDPAPVWNVASALVADLQPTLPDEGDDNVDAQRQAGSLASAVDEALHLGLADVVLVGSTDLPGEELRTTIWRAQAVGINIHVIPLTAPLAPPSMQSVGRLGLAQLTYGGNARPVEDRVVKSLLDRGLAVLGLALISPLMLGIAAAVRLTSPGPALFRQERVGRDGELFTMLKFRTMVQDAESQLEKIVALNVHDSQTLFKAVNDPRITRLGAFLRRFSLDELPQLVNVVRGDMSLVGPRPPLPREVEHYDSVARRRFLMRPGLTGLWQVSGRSDLDPIESVRLDTMYVENWSLGLDAQILARTARAVLSSDGAY